MAIKKTFKLGISTLLFSLFAAQVATGTTTHRASSQIQPPKAESNSSKLKQNVAESAATQEKLLEQLAIKKDRENEQLIAKFRTENVELCALCDAALSRAEYIQTLLSKLTTSAKPTANPLIMILSDAQGDAGFLGYVPPDPRMTCSLMLFTKGEGLTEMEKIVLFHLVQRTSGDIAEAYQNYLTVMNELGTTRTAKALVDDKKATEMKDVMHNRTCLVELAGNVAVEQLDERRGFTRMVESMKQDPKIAAMNLSHVIEKFKIGNPQLCALCDAALTHSKDMQRVLKRIPSTQMPTTNPLVLALSVDSNGFLGYKAPSEPNMGTSCFVAPQFEKGFGLTTIEKIMLLIMVRNSADKLTSDYHSYLKEMSELGASENLMTSEMKAAEIMEAKRAREGLIEVAGNEAVRELEEQKGFTKLVEVLLKAVTPETK